MLSLMFSTRTATPARETTERRSARGTLPRPGGGAHSFLFCMQCGPNVLTDDLGVEDEELRFAWPVLKLLASHVVSASARCDASVKTKYFFNCGLSPGVWDGRFRFIFTPRKGSYYATFTS